ncbi:MAG: preprotein translocase subunit SecY [Verrucomicrobia bacterium]|jgi:preprotein translocase subunit SecY|nr:preprotein translocase subunit SecY [Verrucomicrobiota bacterium]
MISAFVNVFKIPELRDKIFFTLFLLFIARVGANIPLPGIDPMPLQEFFDDQSRAGGGGLLGLYNMFTGGALLRGAIFALGIMPYISASIVFQLLTAAVPSLARLQQEGEVGRQKITQYTRYATLLICLVQSVLLVLTLSNPTQIFPEYDISRYGDIILVSQGWFMLTSVIFLTSGTILLMWLGEQITNRGIGNGISILITVGILADLPAAIVLTFQLFTAPVGETAQLGLGEGILMLLFLFLVIAGVVMVTQAVRKIPVQYAKRVVGRKVFGGQSSYLPLKVNYSGVMPIIFASAIMMFFTTVFQQLGGVVNANWLRDAGTFFQQGQLTYYLVFGLMIFAFSYFWVSVMFKPVQIADDLKKYGGYVPGVRPGEPTARYLDFTMTRLTLAGAAFLTLIAVLPDGVLFSTGVPYQAAQFFGGTGLLIIVGVLLDFLRQVETYLLQRHYDGFLKKGRIRGRSQGRTRQLVDTSGLQEGKTLWRWLLVMVVSGLVAWGLNAALF